MQNSLRVANELKTFLEEMAANPSLTPDALLALKKDTDYIGKAIVVLSRAHLDSVNELWREVQYISRFFGSDYAQGPDQNRLLELLDRFETAMLDDVVILRSHLPR